MTDKEKGNISEPAINIKEDENQVHDEIHTVFELDGQTFRAVI